MKAKVMNLILAAAACTNDDNAVALDNNAPVAARITAGMADSEPLSLSGCKPD